MERRLSTGLNPTPKGTPPPKGEKERVRRDKRTLDRVGGGVGVSVGVVRDISGRGSGWFRSDSYRDDCGLTFGQGVSEERLGEIVRGGSVLTLDWGES